MSISRQLTICLWGIAALVLSVACTPLASWIPEHKELSVQEQTIEFLKRPNVDDLYVADLAPFTIYGFKPNEELGEQVTSGEPMKVYGLLRVILVQPENITLLTEGVAWLDDSQGALEVLRGDLSDVQWDRNEEIVVQKTDLLSFFQQGVIIEARRLTEEQRAEVLVRIK